MIKGIKVIKGSIFKDKRGKLWTSWKKNKKILLNFKHDKFSISKKNVLRGLHYDQKTWKLISCVYGKFFFAVVNCKKSSKDYLRVFSTILSDKENVQILVPPGYANGHLCLSDNCVFHYKLSYSGKYSDVKNQKVLKWNDPRIKIDWPKKQKLITSKRDK
jgi:dTDP-4-dehydrorhamnose 3,5-epimerase